MMNIPTHTRRYSRAERRSDAAVHVMGLGIALVAVPALIATAVSVRSDLSALVGTSIYGAALILMLLSSALYNMIQVPRWSWLLKRLDHSAIYMKIAGTFTPFTLMSGQGLALTIGLWGAAFLGVGLKVVDPYRFRWPGLALYLGMGWGGALAGAALFAALPGPVIALVVAGGLLYTVGVVFYLWEKLPFHNTIWHVFVLVASVVFYAAVAAVVLMGEPGAV
jgi:hemolysin III